MDMSVNQPSKPSIQHAELKRKAMQTFFFDDDDLLFNREGKLSDKQKQRFMMTSKAGAIMLVLSGFVLSALLVWTWEKPVNPSLWIFPVLGVVAFTTFGIYVYRLGGKVYKPGTVKCVIGTATFKNRFGEMFLQINGEFFRSQRKYRKIFLPDLQYKVYYAPSDNTIVSIETGE